jgi:hypothetical protein
VTVPVPRSMTSTDAPKRSSPVAWSFICPLTEYLFTFGSDSPEAVVTIKGKRKNVRRRWILICRFDKAINDLRTILF